MTVRTVLAVLVLAVTASAVAKSKSHFTSYSPWNSKMYPVWSDKDHRHRDCWKGGEVTFDVHNDGPTLTGAKATFNIALRFPQNQSVLPNGEVVWANNCTVNGTHYHQGEAVYPETNTSEEWSGVFPDGTPFTKISDKKPRYVFVWKAWGRYWQVADGPSSSLTVGTDSIPLGSYAMEVVIYHCRGKDKFIPLGYATSEFSITDQVPFSVSLTQLNDVNEADQNFIQNRAIAFSINVHDPSQYLKESDITFNWDFGDNSGTLISRELIVTHTYALPGSFRPQVILQASIPNAGCVEPTAAVATPQPPVPSVQQQTTGPVVTVNPPAPAPTQIDAIAFDVPVSESLPAAVIPDDAAVATAVPESGAIAESNVVPATGAPEDANVDTATNPAAPAIPATGASEDANVTPDTSAAAADATVIPDTNAAAADATVIPDTNAAAADATVIPDTNAAAAADATVIPDTNAAAAADATVLSDTNAAAVDVAVETPASVASADASVLPATEAAVAADAAPIATGAPAETNVVPEAEATSEVLPVAGADPVPAVEAAVVPVAEEPEAINEAEAEIANEVVEEAVENPAAPAVPTTVVVVDAGSPDVELDAEAEVTAAEDANVVEEAVAANPATAQVPLVIAKRQAELPAEEDCTIYRYGSFSLGLDVIQGIESVEIVQVANVVPVTEVEQNQNAVDVTVTCQGSLPSEVCTVISDADCAMPLETVCNAVEPSPECQLILRQFFNNTGVFCINVTMTNDVSLAVASARVSVTAGSSLSTTGTVATVLGVMALLCVVGTIAFTYRRYKEYQPLREDLPGTSESSSRRSSVPMLLWSLLGRQSAGESRPLLQGNVV